MQITVPGKNPGKQEPDKNKVKTTTCPEESNGQGTHTEYLLYNETSFSLFIKSISVLGPGVCVIRPLMSVNMIVGRCDRYELLSQ